MRQYGREDVEYESWYSDFSKRLAKIYTRAELEKQLYGAGRQSSKAAAAHLRAIEASGSMQGNSQRRAQSRNVVAANGDMQIALEGALEIYDLFPEHTRPAEP